LSLAPSTISYWVKAFKAGKLGEIGKGQRPLTDVEMELAQMKKRVTSPNYRTTFKVRVGVVGPAP